MATHPRIPHLVTIALVAACGAVALALSGAVFLNYDTLYGLVWGADVFDGRRPDLRVALAPTPKPLLTVIAVPLAAAGPAAAQTITEGGALLAVGGLAVSCATLAHRLGGRAAALLAVALVLTRIPVLSFGARAYIDVPYAALVLAAIAVEVHRPRAGRPVLALLAAAGLLRPEAWLLSGLYVLYCLRSASARRDPLLLALAAVAPLGWAIHDALLTGDALWSLTGTRDTAATLERPTGPTTAVLLAPRRIGEIVREPVLLAAPVALFAVGHRRRETRVLAAALAATLTSFVVLATASLPALGRYLLLPAMLLLCLAAAGTVTALRQRGAIRLAGSLCAVTFVAFVPAQVGRLVDQRRTLVAQDRAFSDATALVRAETGNDCEPLVVPNHRLVPLLALATNRRPARISTQPRSAGLILVPATERVRRLTLLDRRDRRPREPARMRDLHGSSRANASWRLFARC